MKSWAPMTIFFFWENYFFNILQISRKKKDEGISDSYDTDEVSARFSNRGTDDNDQIVSEAGKIVHEKMRIALEKIKVFSKNSHMLERMGDSRTNDILLEFWKVQKFDDRLKENIVENNTPASIYSYADKC